MFEGKCWKTTVSCSCDCLFPDRHLTYNIILQAWESAHSCLSVTVESSIYASSHSVWLRYFKHTWLCQKEPQEDGIITDGSALINAIPLCLTFDNYAREDIVPKVNAYGVKHERVDIVFDVYKKSSQEEKGTRDQGSSDRIHQNTTKLAKYFAGWKQLDWIV